MNNIALWINVCAGDWTAERAIIDSNGKAKFHLKVGVRVTLNQNRFHVRIRFLTVQTDPEGTTLKKYYDIHNLSKLLKKGFQQGVKYFILCE